MASQEALHVNGTFNKIEQETLVASSERKLVELGLDKGPPVSLALESRGTKLGLIDDMLEGSPPLQVSMDVASTPKARSSTDSAIRDSAATRSSSASRARLSSQSATEERAKTSDSEGGVPADSGEGGENSSQESSSSSEASSDEGDDAAPGTRRV